MPHNKKSDSFLERSPPSHLLAAKFMSIVICHLVLQHREGLLCQLLFKEYILAHQTFDACESNLVDWCGRADGNPF